MSNYRPRRRYNPAGGPKGAGAKDAEETANGAAASGQAARRARSVRPADPRRTAYDVLAAVRDRAAYANLLLPKLLADRQLSGRDAALATELTYGTLRGQGTYDAVLAACSDRPLAKLDPPVLDVLRLGAHQLLSTRIGAHAAVATSVDLAKSVAGPRVSGYVNAVLRRVATRDLETWLDIVAPSPVTDRDGYLATRYSHPRWVVAAYRDALGDAADAAARRAVISDALAGHGPSGAPAGPEPSPEPSTEAQPAEVTGGAPGTELEAALAAGNARPRVTMAAFPGGPPRAEIMPPDATAGRWSPYAFSLAAGDPTPLVASGAAAVQDEGSQLAAIALSRAPLSGDGATERWLDLCAGPGGKSRLLYGLAAGAGATLIAAELHPHRAVLVRDALTRAAPAPPGTSGTGWEVVVADGTRPPWPDGTFDRVLVDAPCSGLGALRRRPEARWRKSADDLKELTALQRDLLRSALAAVRPGGVVAYVTCSPVPAETTDVVTDVLASTPDTEILDAPAVLSGIPAARAADPLFAQLWPHRHGTDAIFIALLRRRL